jgi:hypothetical protein
MSALLSGQRGADLLWACSHPRRRPLGWLRTAQGGGDCPAAAGCASFRRAGGGWPLPSCI